MRPIVGENRMVRRNGFTMLELMLVVVLLGIVSAMSAGRIHDLIIQQRVVRAATAVQNGLESAFALAGRNRQPVRISWSPASMQFGVTDRSGNVFYRRIGLGTDAYGLESANVSVSRSPLEVYPGGLANDTPAVTLSVSGMTKRIRMTRSGLVRVQ
jgi:prepilin-type N-terminal cleavage/methylation domain-containing protein